MRSKQSRHLSKFMVAGAVGIVVLVAGGVWLGSQKSDPPVATAPTYPIYGNGTPVPVTENSHVALIDSWSLASAGGTKLTVTNADGQDVQAVLQPATAADLALIAKSSPAVIQAVAARTVSSDPKLACTAVGCSVGSRAIQFSEVVDPASGTGPIADVFRGWKLGPLHLIVLPDTATDIKLGSSTLTLEQGASYALGVAFGQLFQLNPTWLGSGPRDGIRSDLVDAGTVNVKVPVLWQGPGVASTVAESLLPSQLTSYSSPTTGCIPGVLCVPTAVASAKNSLLVSSSFARCDTHSMQANRGAQLLFVARAGSITATLPAPIHQYGVYTSGVLPGGLGTPPSLTGPAINFQVADVEVYDSIGLLSIAGFAGPDTPQASAWSETDVAKFVGTTRFVACPVGTTPPSTVVVDPSTQTSVGTTTTSAPPVANPGGGFPTTPGVIVTSPMITSDGATPISGVPPGGTLDPGGSPAVTSNEGNGGTITPNG